MLYLRSGEISSLAAQTIQKYKEYIGVDWELFKVNPITLAEMWGLDVKFVDLGEDSDIMGFTAFNDMDITLTDANQSDITLELSGRTIVINEALTRGCAGRLNFTIAHEIAHHIIDIVCGANYSVKFRLLPHFEKANNRYSLDYDEYMANQLAAALLMFGVSKSALAIRLQKKGLLGEYIFAGYESLLDIFPDTAA